jgi:hypothetical protein
MQEIVSDSFTKQGLRTIAFAYKEYSEEEFNLIREEHGNLEGEHD